LKITTRESIIRIWSMVLKQQRNCHSTGYRHRSRN